MNAVVREARGWIGTPFVHQGRSKGAGCDCLGLVLGVLERCGHSIAVPAYAEDWQYADERFFYKGLLANLEQTSQELSVGQLIGFALRPRGPLQHLGILSQSAPIPRFVHAYGTHGVVESALTDAWQRRIVARFELPTGD